MLEICLDAGSTHMGKKAYGMELIDMAEDVGADYIKFQLFPNLPEYTAKGNVWLNPDLFLELYNYSQKKKKVKITASTFDTATLDVLMSLQVPFIKFSYSQNTRSDEIKGILNTGRRVVVSCDEMTRRPKHEHLTQLYCISEYPVKYMVDFVGRFPERFDGFSDHTLEYHQTLQAVAHGADFIEKHITLEYSDVTCPDAKFALNAKQAAKMVKELRAMR